MPKDTLLKELDKKKVTGINMESIEFLSQNFGKEGKIAEPQQEHAIDETITINIDRSGMSATATFTPPSGGLVLSVPQIVNALREAKIVFGIDTEMIKALGGNPGKQFNTPYVLAKGKQPVAGADSTMRFTFQMARDKAPRILENGQVDHKNLGGVENVHKGDALCILTPATEGDPGMTVTGAELKPIPGKSRPIPVGKYTELSPDGLQLLASYDGMAVVQDGRITVMRVMEIKGDVGVSTGHITFAGDVVIERNVISTFNVTAEGSVEVGGCIEASTITAGGDVIIRQGIKGMAHGMSKCLVRARGNISSKFIENATVIAGGVVRADTIMHSTVSSNLSVVASGRLGNIIGGRVSALKDIACNNAGSDGNVASVMTKLEVGVTPEVREQLNKLIAEVDDLRKELDKCEQLIQELAHQADFNPKLGKRKYEMENKRDEIQEQLPSKLRDIHLIREQMKNDNAGGIHIKGMLRPPATMSIGAASRSFDATESNQSFRASDGEIVSGPYIFRE